MADIYRFRKTKYIHMLMIKVGRKQWFKVMSLSGVFVTLINSFIKPGSDASWAPYTLVSVDIIQILMFIRTEDGSSEPPREEDAKPWRLWSLAADRNSVYASTVLSFVASGRSSFSTGQIPWGTRTWMKSSCRMSQEVVRPRGRLEQGQLCTCDFVSRYRQSVGLCLKRDSIHRSRIPSGTITARLRRH